MVLGAALWAGACSSPLAGGVGSGGAAVGDTATRAYGTGGFGGVGGGTGGAASDAGTGIPSSGPGQACATDVDCWNAFLACISVQDGQVTRGQCEARYQLPCQFDSDCGPAGFTCESDCPDGGGEACTERCV